jgi:D-sedoheptulose 7-phosphate isomerase
VSATLPLTRSLAEREAVLTAFLEAEQERLARTCFELARAFTRGGTLVPFGVGPAVTDAAHVAVEFVHPVIVGKRALPAVACAPAVAQRAGDVALALSHGAPEPEVEGFLAGARRRGLTTIAFTGARAGAGADHAFAVPSDDRAIVQEVQETAYHVLWELVHVFFEHPGLLEEECLTCGDVAVPLRVVAVEGATAVVERKGVREQVAVDLVEDVAPGDVLLCHAGVAIEKAPEDDPTAFLYPFLEAEEDDLDAVLADVRASTLRKGADVVALRRGIDVAAVERCAADVRARLDRGGRLVAFGNGGSSTDAQDVAIDLLARGRPALALNDDVATITGVANDVGFENVFARQLIPLGRAEDVALGISTSGSSANVVAGLEEAHRRGMLTIGIAGYDGGRLGALPWLDHLFVARSDYVPRLQEAHATIYHLLLEAAAR